MPATAPAMFRVGIDENGLGPRLGPMVVTGVLAQVTEAGDRTLNRKLRGRLAEDLGDSKAVVSHGNMALAEAWARALVPDARTPSELLEQVSLEGVGALQAPCPASARPQCWHVEGEHFEAEDDLVRRVAGHRQRLEARGVVLRSVLSSVTCTLRLNALKAEGVSRFTADLHAMERLVLAFRATAGSDVHAVCGKVGGIGDYRRFFGPLAGRLHVELEQGRAASAYRFPGLGEVRFVRDADAKDPLVMLASIVGKYLREILMARITRYHGHGPAGGDDALDPSGYHDPVTARFVELTARRRRILGIPNTCFERD